MKDFWENEPDNKSHDNTRDTIHDTTHDTNHDTTHDLSELEDQPVRDCEAQPRTFSEIKQKLQSKGTKIKPDAYVGFSKLPYQVYR